VTLYRYELIGSLISEPRDTGALRVFETTDNRQQTNRSHDTHDN
jgi:hypothetical protein